MRRSLAALILLLTLFAAGFACRDQLLQAQDSTAQPLRTAGDRPIDIRHIRLDLRVDLPKRTVDARATLDLCSLRPLSSISLDAVGFSVKAVRLATNGRDGFPVRFTHDGGKLVVPLDPAWPTGQSASLTVDYRVHKPKDGLFFFGPTAAEPNVPLTVWSQGESIANRYWIPCLDQPNQRQSTELVVTVGDGFEVLSNGRLVERRVNPADQTVTFHWRQDKPHPAYLITLVVGQFDIVREEWEKMPVLYYVPRGQKDKVPYTFGHTRAMLTYFSQRFGIRYPWEKYAQVVVEQFTEGGMENTSATTLADHALTDACGLVDGSPDGLIAHELAHQWWGDMVTCSDWAHVWLNEGFASYAEALWEEHSKGPDDYAYDLFRKAHGAISGGKTRPVVDHHYATPDSMFDDRVYPKGAWLLHMLRKRLGDDTFWKCLQRYGTEFQFRSAETADFRRVLERETGRDLERFFHDWTERPGSPILEVETEYLPESKQARVHIKQTQKEEPFHFPLRMVFHCPPAKEAVVVQGPVTQREHTFWVALPGPPTLVEVDPEQAVLAEIKETQGRDWWLAQLRQATSVACRIRAAQHFGQGKTAGDFAILAQALATEKFWGVQREIVSALGNGTDSVCRDALLRGLQNNHAKVRRACVEQLGKFTRDPMVAEALKGVLLTGDPGYQVEAKALEAYARTRQADAVAVLRPWLNRPSLHEVLRCAALTGLGESGNLSVLDTLLAWTKKSRPRDCRIAALNAAAALVKAGKATDAQKQQVVETHAACLEGEGLDIRRTAITGLHELEWASSPALAVLDSLAEHDPDERLRTQARAAAAHIRKQAPATEELNRLRGEVERLQKEQEKLKARLGAYEKTEKVPK
jgi:aminopeptidase N